MIKAGRKTKLWNQIRKELKNEFEEMGITSCEIRFADCWVSNALSFAHLDKRRYLSEDDLRVCVLACTSCHGVVERWPRQQMREYLEEIISKRI